MNTAAAGTLAMENIFRTMLHQRCNEPRNRHFDKGCNLYALGAKLQIFLHQSIDCRPQMSTGWPLSKPSGQPKISTGDPSAHCQAECKQIFMWQKGLVGQGWACLTLKLCFGFLDRKSSRTYSSRILWWHSVGIFFLQIFEVSYRFFWRSRCRMRLK